MFIYHQPFSGRIQNNSHSVEWNVPCQLLPTCKLQVRRIFSMYSSLLKIANNLIQDFLIRDIVRTDNQFPKVEVFDMPQSDFIGTDKGQPSGNGNIRKPSRKIFFQTKSVLQQDNHTFGVKEGFEQSRQDVVCGGFQANKDDITNGHLLSRWIGIYFIQMKITINRINL